MEFSPFNPIVRLCIQAMDQEEKGKPDEAAKLFLQGWNEATNDFEKFLTAHFTARQQKTIDDKLHWLETTLKFAVKVNDDAVKSAFPSLYLNIAKCHEELNDFQKAKEFSELADSCKFAPEDKGPFYHGTKAELKIGEFLKAGGNSNYKSDLKMNHIYFTALITGAGLAASLAKGDGNEKVYLVEPTGIFENDPNLTNKKFPGNPTRSYRSEFPLKIVGEVADWKKQTPEELERFRKKVENSKAEIIN